MDLGTIGIIIFGAIFVHTNVKLEPSQWHEASFAVEDRFARDLADLLTEEGLMCS